MKQNPIVLIIVAVAALFLFLQIPRISQQAQKTHRYQNYTDFQTDFANGLITILRGMAVKQWRVSVLVPNGGR